MSGRNYHLEQTCPKCGLYEAAGSYCTRCCTATTAHPAKRSPAQGAATLSLGAGRAKQSGQGER